MTSVIQTIPQKNESIASSGSSKNGLLAHMRGAAGVLLVLTLITGVAYPLLVTLAAQAIFPWQANGSMIDHDGKPVRNPAYAAGSELIGQNFSDPACFWPRPSATAPVAYTSYNQDKATGSSGSNQSPAGQAFAEAVQSRIAALHAADPGNDALIPVDLVTASGSGLDPHESIAAARYQAARVAKARGVSIEKINALIDQQIQERSLGILGEPVVHVLKLNLALDAQYPRPSGK